MKRAFTLTLVTIAACMAAMAGDFSKFRGVWASDSAEAVICDAAVIFFENTPSGMRARLDVPSYGIHSLTTYRDSTFVTEETTPLTIATEGRRLKIGDKIMTKVEDIETCEPYERPQAT